MIQLGQEKLPSLINDPFKKTSIEGISIFIGERYNSDGCVHANIFFKNGDTRGEQKVKGDTFDEVVLRLRAIIANLD